MAPSNEDLAIALRGFIKETVEKDEDDLLTVRYVRDKVEEKLNLDPGFFVTKAWRDKSKQIIKEYSAKLLDAKETVAEQAKAAAVESKPKPKPKKPTPTKKEPPTLKKAPKRVVQPENSRPAKRRKKEATSPSDLSEEDFEDEPTEEPSDLSIEEEESAESSFEDSDLSDAPKSKKNANSKAKARAPAKGKTKKKTNDASDESEDETSEDLSDVEESDVSTPPKKVTPKSSKPAKETTTKKAKKVKEVPNKRESKEIVHDSEDVTSEEDTPVKKDESEDEKPKKKSESPKKTTSQPLPQRKRPKAALSDDDEEEEETKPKNVETTGHDSDSSEMSVLLDEAPAKRRSKKSKTEGSTKSAKSREGKEKPPAKELSLSEQQIKTLQSQLVKCGIRKIWAFELKQYGEDNKAKAKHLERMLKDIGMTGRFSEQRAKEIKELRELQADLEAVKEGEKNWGLESGRRNRGQRKSLKESSGSDSEDEDDHGPKAGKARSRSASEIPAIKAAKVAKAKQELAFLGDEESDSD